ncbi:MAG: hypothetical protein M3177_00010 [Pseudomonadota bacterium]|nr:hypothetical protein [Pseudomonadota bacterium]
MKIDPANYTDPDKVIGWLDIDPSFDSDWVGWSTLRTYAYVPGLRPMLNPISPINYGRIAHIASALQDDLYQSRNYHGIIKNENLTVDQLKFLTGTSTTDSGRLKPLRLDKVLLGLYAINAEFVRQGRAEIRPKIILSAYNVIGLSKAFNALDKPSKEAVRTELAAALDQSDQLASDLLKGNKVSIDSALAAYGFLSGRSEFKGSLPETAGSCLETPSRRHTPASVHEDFSRGRLDKLPHPFRRPG